MKRREGGKTIQLMEVRNGRPRFRTTRNSQAAISTATDFVRDLMPYQLDGAGVTIGLWDGDSVLTNHQEFAGGRVQIGDSYLLTDPHATHVGGTLAAAGVDGNAKGMAPAALIESYEWDHDFSEMISRAASFQGESGKLCLSNHSYGDDGGWLKANIFEWWGQGWSPGASDNLFGLYEDFAQALDEITYNAPYFLQFKAAGNDRADNPQVGESVRYDGTVYAYDPALHPAGDAFFKDGYDTIPTDGNAKNILTVGSVTDAVSNGVRAPGAAVPISRSSWGPADDGRIKPDVVANGDALYSTSSAGPASYYTESGTSMASPNACGSAALLIQHFSNLFSGRIMRASSLKALILHTADDIGRAGPDYQYGWGLMNTLRAVQYLDEYAAGSHLRLQESMLSDEDLAHAYYFTAHGAAPVRVTLCWTDAPGTVSYALDDRTPNLVNDLDLKLIAPDGTVFFPFALDYNNPTNPATALAENKVDNVEQVYLELPQPGVYQVVVDYDGALTNGVQWYSLLMEGDDGADSDADGMPDLWEQDYFGGPTNAIALGDEDGDGENNLSEYVTGYDPTNSAFRFNVSADFPHLLSWNANSGRVYNVSWSSNLVDMPFTNLSGDMAFSTNYYFAPSNTAAPRNFYRVDVRIDP